ncbi:MAG: hypothetical protein Q8R02_12680 [Hyphomonadaceae bacterium]|nr:hypothetical protein [Hyphomonadaceae bacterium]
MKFITTLAAAAVGIGLVGTASAQQGAAAPAATATATAKAPEYVAIPMEITVNKPAAEVWAKVGGYCDLGKWLRAGAEIPCVVTSGNGGVGSVRKIANSVTEVLTAKTDLSYGYTQPAVEGKWYNLYHGFLEAKPVDVKSSKLVYTLMLDVSDKPDQAAKDADVSTRRKMFEGALANMKKMAEGG